MSASSPTPSQRGRLVPVEGKRRLRAVENGPHGASPLVVMEAGAFGFSADWEAVQARLAKAGFRSLAYDRAGLGFSDAGREPRDAEAIAADLDRLLDALGEKGPYIYCGHSMAGLHARMFAARHADTLEGVVLVDATTPEAVRSGLVVGLIGAFAVFCRIASLGVEAGLFRPFAGLGLGNAIGVEGPAAREKRWAFGDPEHNRWATREVEAWVRSAGQAMGAGAFDADLPVWAVVAARRGSARLRGVQAAPDNLPGKGHVTRVEGASHASLLGPKHAEAIVNAITYVQGAAFDGAPGRRASRP